MLPAGCTLLRDEISSKSPMTTVNASQSDVSLAAAMIPGRRLPGWEACRVRVVDAVRSASGLNSRVKLLRGAHSIESLPGPA
jgi:hypothetical protein